MNEADLPLAVSHSSAQSIDKRWSMAPELCAANMEKRKETHELVLKDFIVPFLNTRL